MGSNFSSLQEKNYDQIIKTKDKRQKGKVESKK